MMEGGDSMFGELLPEYERQLENYDDEIDMCNQLGLNLDEIYEDSTEDEDW